MKHAPDHVAHIAATLLAGRHDAEPHHIRGAVAAARAILDEAYAGEQAEPPAEEAEPAADQDEKVAVES